MTIRNLRPVLLTVIVFVVAFGGASWLFDGSRSERALKKKGVQISHDEHQRVMGVTAEGIELSDDDLALVAGFRYIKYLSLTQTKVSLIGIEKLRTATSLLTLDLSHSSIPGESLATFGQLPKLTMLKLIGCREVKDEHLTHLSQSLKLQNLDLADTSITAAGLKHLHTLPMLASLRLEQCPAVDDAAIEPLSRITTLRELALNGCHLSLAGFHQLRQALPKTRTFLPPASFEELRDLSRHGRFGASESGAITSYSINTSDRKDETDTTRTPEQIAAQAAVQDFLPGDFVPFKGLHDLQSLSLQGDNLTDALILELAPNPILKSLSLEGKTLTDASLPAIANFPNLTHLSLRGTHITDTGLSVMAHCPNLEWLTLKLNEVQGNGLRHLSQLTRLEMLRLSTPSDQGLWEGIAPLSQLERLIINAPVSDESLQNIPALAKLDNIEFYKARFTGAGLAHLSRLPSLTSLYFQDVETLEGEPFIESLVQLKSLVGASVYGSRVSRNHVERLRTLRPDIGMQWFDPDSKTWVKFE